LWWTLPTLAVAVEAVAAREQAALAAAGCVPVGLVGAAPCAEVASTGAARLRVTAWQMPGRSSESRTQSPAGLTSAALADPTLAGPAGLTSVCLAHPATGLAGTEAGPEEAGAQIMVGVGVPPL